MLNDLGHSLGVTLVAVHYDVFLITIEQMSELLPEGFYG